MTFQITPRDYLGMLQAQDSDFQDDPLSLGKAIALSMFANHISEHVFAAYCGSDTSKIDCQKTAAAYRTHIESMKPELILIRDLCDYGKHGPLLERRTKTELRQTMVAEPSMFCLA